MSAVKIAPSTEAEADAMYAAQGDAILAAAAAAQADGIKRVMILPLLNEHSALIEAMRAACKEEIHSDPDPVMANHYNDNVFLLRFLVAAKFKVEKAISAVKGAIAWRNKHREALALVRSGKTIAGRAELGKYNVGYEHKTTLDGAPLLIVRSGVSDISAAGSKVSKEHIYNAMVLAKEAGYIQCDQLSRQKGYFVQLVSIVDMAHDSMLRAFDSKWMGILGECTKDIEAVYPLLPGPNIIMNAPGWLKAVMAFGSKFMSAESMENMVICRHKVASYDAKRKGVDIAKDPYAWAKFVAPENVPTFLGGTCACHKDEKYPNGRCICGVDNDRTIQVTVKPYPEQL